MIFVFWPKILVFNQIWKEISKKSRKEIYQVLAEFFFEIFYGMRKSSPYVRKTACAILNLKNIDVNRTRAASASPASEHES